MFLGVNYRKLLEMALFIPSKIVLGVEKFYVFGRKISDSLEDAHI
jgi:hypothetical protein